MYVGLKMITDVVSVTKDTLLAEANDLMEKHRLWTLPVLKAGKLIGYLTKEDVRGALPSPATLLSKHELPEVMDHVTVADFVHTKDIITVKPETEIEQAADIMSKHNIAELVVVNDAGKMVGYINRSVMLDVLVEEMGLHRGGSRFAIEFEDRPGVMAEVSGLISKMGLNFVSAASFYQNDAYILVFRVQTADLTPILSELETRGYTLVGPEKFADQWQ